MDNSGERANAYKVGFLEGLADLGVLPSELYAAFEKKAKTDMSDPLDVLTALGGGMSRPVGELGTKALDIGTGTLGTLGKGLVVAPMAIGGAAGIAAQRLESPDPKAIDTLQKAELVGLYKRLAAKMKERQARRATGERVV
jgi:hypothetical protein